jgi:hypothetical protein
MAEKPEMQILFVIENQAKLSKSAVLLFLQVSIQFILLSGNAVLNRTISVR